MYLHIGNNVLLPTKEIICILNGRVDFPDRPIKAEAITGSQAVRSTILTDRAVYLSSINSVTLQGRVGIKS